MSKRRPVWDNYKEKVAKKRMRKGEEKGATGPKGGLTVQHLSANVEGKCQKYSRIRPLTLVPCEKELTNTIWKISKLRVRYTSKRNWNVMCLLENMVLPLPSQDKSRTGKFCMCASWKFSNTPQTKSLEHKQQANSQDPKASQQPETPPRSSFQHPHSRQTTSVSVRPSPSVVRSVSLSQMLKLGKVIVPDIDVVTLRLEEFCISRMEWLEPFEVSLLLERKPLANGAFHEAFLAKSIAGVPKGKYVLKKYLEGEKKESRHCFNP
ncbi:Hypothetical predicted protein [Paramuricea clavata]|uniref:Uncharacterized protein n=1 Tax=Paramuricea clavata TaxID=317549 RepID=A0A7D9EYY6_PARCT|nr:Hypothetical predicted protein [Paramuricea clavata]